MDMYDFKAFVKKNARKASEVAAVAAGITKEIVLDVADKTKKATVNAADKTKEYVKRNDDALKQIGVSVGKMVATTTVLAAKAVTNNYQSSDACRAAPGFKASWEEFKDGINRLE